MSALQCSLKTQKSKLNSVNDSLTRSHNELFCDSKRHLFFASAPFPFAGKVLAIWELQIQGIHPLPPLRNKSAMLHLTGSLVNVKL